jgi:hypothetical protein
MRYDKDSRRNELSGIVETLFKCVSKTTYESNRILADIHKVKSQGNSATSRFTVI